MQEKPRMLPAPLSTRNRNMFCAPGLPCASFACLKFPCWFQGRPPQTNLQKDVTCRYDPSRVQQGWGCHDDQSRLHVYNNNITNKKDYHQNTSIIPATQIVTSSAPNSKIPCPNPAPQPRKKYAHGVSTMSSRGRTDREFTLNPITLHMPMR